MRARPSLRWRRLVVALGASAASFTLLISFSRPYAAAAEAFNSHDVVLDNSNKLVSWYTQDRAYDHMMWLAWDFTKNKVPLNGPNDDLRAYLIHCCFSSNPPYDGTGSVHNPAGLYGMFVESLIAYLPYSGDTSLIPIVRGMLDYQLAHGTTPANWNWPSVPFASAVDGRTTYTGDGDDQRDGPNGLEPDKIGELGAGYLRFYELTGEVKYRDAAINCANALASHMRAGTATQSPWPFRVDGQSGTIREEYTANAVGAVRLFDELIRLNLGSVAAYQSARNTAWNWVLTYPMQNNNWNAYFEDVVRDPSLTNRNQLVPMETARYILNKADPASVDPQWQTHIPALIGWVQSTFGRGPYWGAQAIDEQGNCCGPQGLGSHTARWASINALWYQKSGNPTYKENAYRSFNYASYFASESGVVAAVVDDNWWYTDGYADYIRHFMEGIGAVPEWAPAGETHLVHSTSVVRSVTYAGPSDMSYSTFDSASTEAIRMPVAPGSVSADGAVLPRLSDLSQPGWTYDDASATPVLRIRHDTGTNVAITSGPPPPTPIPTPTQVGEPPPPNGMQTATFNDLNGQDQPLNGQYPSGEIDWGSGGWFLSAPWGAFSSKSISFDSANVTSLTLTFLSPGIVASVDALNGGASLARVSLACGANPTRVVNVAPNAEATISTGWTTACTTVTVSSSTGWDTNFDNLVFSIPAAGPVATATVTSTPTASRTPTRTLTPSPSPTSAATRTPTPTVSSTLTFTPTPTSTSTPTDVQTQSVTFDSANGQDRPLNGRYPSGVISWGTGSWFLSGPWGAFTTKSVSFSTASATSASFTFLSPRLLLSFDVYNGDFASATITAACGTNPTRSQVVGGMTRTSIDTQFTTNCTSVTLGSSNGWSTNFDNLVFE